MEGGNWVRACTDMCLPYGISIACGPLLLQTVPLMWLRGISSARAVASLRICSSDWLIVTAGAERADDVLRVLRAVFPDVLLQQHHRLDLRGANHAHFAECIIAAHSA